MCGICGFTWEDKALVKRMMGSLAHRGPDQEGMFCDKGISLGHRRLSIIDLSEKGRQPMWDWEEEHCIVFNGEIYNFQALREELEEKGHRFRSQSDTEVILRAYREHGEGCVSLLNGMFAFALWDRRRKRLFLARDPSGIKPLYYSLDSGNLIFSSEIKALLEHPLPREIDREALSLFLTFRYSPTEKTLFRGIRKLLPGHCATFDLSSRNLSLKRYWSFTPREEEMSLQTAVSAFDSVMEESVQGQLVSDVPVGAFLSGGLDSSYVVALIKKAHSGPLKTFSVGFSHDSYDESMHAKSVAEHLGTEHHSLLIEADAAQHLPSLIRHLDEPIADPAAVPTYHLAAFARTHVTVALTGEGADELLGGYRKYRQMQRVSSYRAFLPGFLRSAGSAILRLSGNPRHRRLADIQDAPSLSESYLSFISYFTRREQEGLLLRTSGFPALSVAAPFFPPSASSSPDSLSSSLMRMDFSTWMPEDVLMKVDRMTMASGLEARVPFLDNRMLSFCERLPARHKLHAGQEKIVLRKALQGKVPDAIAARRKHGFDVPVSHWLSDELKAATQDLLSRESVIARGWFHPDPIQRLLGRLSKDPPYASRQLWLLLNLETWARIFLDGASSSSFDALR